MEDLANFSTPDYTKDDYAYCAPVSAYPVETQDKKKGVKNADE